MISKPRFTAEDADRAHDEWGANCGPGAIAAICGLTLSELRPHLGDFEAKHYTNPTLMWAILDSLKVRWGLRKPATWPDYGLVRIQWHGPWMAAGVPRAARYRQTHWVGAAKNCHGETGVFDINAIGNGTGWTSLDNWRSLLVPWLLSECVPRADGTFSLTHSVEVDPLLRDLLSPTPQAAV
jgi:hypothetical protein